MDSFKLVWNSTKNRQAGVLYIFSEKMTIVLFVGKKCIGWTNELFCQDRNLDVLFLKSHPFLIFFLLRKENIESKNLTFWV